MWALWAPAVCATGDGDHQRRLELFKEARAIAFDIDNVCWGSALAINVVEAAIDNDDPAAAEPLLRSELDSATPGDPTTAGYLIENAAILALQRGDQSTGLRLMAASRADLKRAGYRESPDEAQRRRRWIDAARQHLDPAAADALWDEGGALTSAEALEAARGVVAEPTATGTASDGAAPGNVFIREGEFWTLGYAGAVTRIKDSKGLRDVARLIAARGQEVAAVDLAGGPTRGREAHAERGLHPETSVGELLDAEARAQYRARLVELEADISDADRCNDPHRASRAREERAVLLDQLGVAVGLAGRPRVALDPAERARKAVTWRVRDAIHHVEVSHPALGRHLRRSVRTGSFCAYDPDQPVEWRL